MGKPILSIIALILLSLVLIMYVSISLFKINTARSNKLYGLYGVCMFIIVIANILMISGSKPWMMWIGIVIYYIGIIGLVVTISLSAKDKGYDNNKIAQYLTYLLLFVVSIGIGSVGGRIVTGLKNSIAAEKELAEKASESQTKHGGGGREKFTETLSSYLYSDSKSPYSHSDDTISSDTSLF